MQDVAGINHQPMLPMLDFVKEFKVIATFGHIAVGRATLLLQELIGGGKIGLRTLAIHTLKAGGAVTRKPGVYV